MICPATGRTCESTGCTPLMRTCQQLFTPIHAPNTGWVCPRCQAVHAPHVQSCQCHQYPVGPTCNAGEPPR